MKDWIFLGDAHFPPYHRDSWEPFLKLIEERRGQMEALVIMGDFFDFWFGFPDPSPLKEAYRELIEGIEGLAEGGTEVLYMEGNHDFSIGRSIEGVRAYPTSAEFLLDGRRVFVAHGDRFMGFPLYFLLKNPLSCKLISSLSPQLVTKVAFLWSRASRWMGMRRGVRKVAEGLRGFARQKIAQGFDVVILAHTHLAEECPIEVGGRRGIYYNVGSWQELSFLLYRPREGFSLQKFPYPRP